MYQYGETVVSPRQRMALPYDTPPEMLAFKSRLATTPIAVRTLFRIPIPTWQSSAPEAEDDFTQSQRRVRTCGDATVKLRPTRPLGWFGEEIDLV
jgi:hypothetical protein